MSPFKATKVIKNFPLGLASQNFAVTFSYVLYIYIYSKWCIGHYDLHAVIFLKEATSLQKKQRMNVLLPV